MSINIVYQMTESMTTTHRVKLTTEGERQFRELKTSAEKRAFVKERHNISETLQSSVSDQPNPKNMIIWEE